MKSPLHCFLVLVTLFAEIAVADTHPANPLMGTWTLVAADFIRPDGTRAPDYGPSAKGVLMIDAEGRYSLQIYSAERPKFAANDKVKGTAVEYREAILGASTHFGTIAVDAAANTFTLNVEKSSYPNQEGVAQKRTYELKDGVLSYKVATRPDGNTPISIWRKLQ